MLTWLYAVICCATPIRALIPLTLQTKIFEVLQLKKEEGQKLWVSDECTVLDAVKTVRSAVTLAGRESLSNQRAAQLLVCQLCASLREAAEPLAHPARRASNVRAELPATSSSGRCVRQGRGI